MRPRLFVFVPVLMVAVACGGEETATPAATVTLTETASAPPPAAVPAPATTAPAPVTTAPAPPAAAPAPGTTAPAPQAAVSAAMPNLVGENLQDAQDAVQRALGTFVFSTSHDADGQGRNQVIDSGWQVCDQTPAPGTAITADSSIDFGVVRVSESCP